MEFYQYQKIRLAGDLETEGLLDRASAADPIHVFEKLDGSNVQVRMGQDGTLRCGKRTEWIDETNEQFQGFYDWAMGHAPFRSLDPDLILFGEWLTHHTVRYDDVCYEKFYLFDVFSFSRRAYLPYGDVKRAADLYRCYCVPPFYVGSFQGYDHLQQLVGQTSYALDKGEGVVIKRYGFRNRFDQQVWAKMTCEEFREKFDEKVAAERAADKYDATDICRALITPARVRKIREKGRRGELPQPVEFCGDMKDMRWIPAWLYEDILDEDLRYIAMHFKKVDFERLRHRTTGFVAPILKEIIAEQELSEPKDADYDRRELTFGEPRGDGSDAVFPEILTGSWEHAQVVAAMDPLIEHEFP